MLGGVGLGARTKFPLGLAGGEGALRPLNVLRLWLWLGGDSEVSTGDIFNTTFCSFSRLKICSREFAPAPKILEKVIF